MVYGDRLMRILAEEALCRLPNIEQGQVSSVDIGVGFRHKCDFSG